MRLKFWKKEESEADETVIQVDKTEGDYKAAVKTSFYVKAQTSDKALKIYRKLLKEK